MKMKYYVIIIPASDTCSINISTQIEQIIDFRKNDPIINDYKHVTKNLMSDIH